MYDERPENILTDFLTEYYSDQIESVLLSSDHRLHYPLYVDFAELMEHDSLLAHEILNYPTEYLPLFDQAARSAQELVCKEVKKVWELESRSQGLECPAPSIKEFVHVRIEICGPMFDNPDFCPSIGRVRVKHRGILLTLKGTVIRSGATKMIEGERMYECRKCKHRFKVHPELESRNSIPKPTACPSEKSKYCESTSFQLLEGNQVCHDYQEIKIQESTQVLGVGAIPRSIPVILQDDLVDVVKAGDEVIVTGVLTAKWSPDLKDVRCDLEMVLVANYVRRINEIKLDIEIPDDIRQQFENFWSEFKETPLKGRNAILRAICPQVYGLFTVKLAGACQKVWELESRSQGLECPAPSIKEFVHVRIEICGPMFDNPDFCPSIGRVRVKHRGILLTLKGTVIRSGATKMIEGERMYECRKCKHRFKVHPELDSRNSIPKPTACSSEKSKYCESTSFQLLEGNQICHDYQEIKIQENTQVLGVGAIPRSIPVILQDDLVDVVKAGDEVIVTGVLSPDQSLSVNTTLSGPLISRFDIVLVLLDTKNPDWDKVVSDHILDQAEPEKDKCHEDMGKKWPLSLLRRYIHFVRGYFRPTLSKAAEVISSYYQLQRRSATENAARTTVRMLESLIRLAQAHARLMFRNEVTQLDAIAAILCIESSMTTFAIVDSVGNALHSNFTDNSDQEYAIQEQQILAKLKSFDEFPDFNQ